MFQDHHSNINIKKPWPSTIIVVLIAVLLVLWAVNHAAAYTDFYADCTKGYEFSDNNTDAVVLSPLNYTCQARCKRECGSFSRVVKTTEEKGDVGVELNSSIITACMPECQSGKLFKSYYFEAMPRDKLTDPVELEVKAAIPIGSACTEGEEWVNNSAFQTKLVVSPGDRVRLALTGSAEDSNKVYLCGRKEIKLLPIFPNINAPNFSIYTAADWNRSTQTAWKSRSEHPCLIDFTDTKWTSLSNKSLWSDYSLWGGRTDTPCSWHGRNRNFTNTGIYAQDGDELYIEWKGTYATRTDGSKTYARKELAECMNNPHIAPDTRNICKVLWKDISTLSLSIGSSNIINLVGEDARPPDMPIGILYRAPSSAPPEQFRIYGMLGKAIDLGLKTEINKSVDGCDSESEASYKDPRCIKILDPGTADYLFTGKLEGFSKERQLIGIRHFDTSSYQDNLGGYEVDISWGGCLVEDGARVEYAVIPEQDLNTATNALKFAVPDEAWKEVPPESMRPSGFLKIDATAQGILFLRIKPMEPPANASPDMAKLYTNAANRFGQYYILAEKLDQPTSMLKSGPIDKLLRIIIETLLGKDRAVGEAKESGVVYKLFSSITKSARFVNLVQAMIFAYIAFTGIAFLMGLMNLNQQEAIKRLAKIGVLLTVISPSSWEFFGGYLVPFFIDGTLNIIALILSASLFFGDIGITPEALSKDPLLIFSLFDGPLLQMTSAAVWKKIFGLFLTGVLGFFVAVSLVIAIVYYLLIVIKASVMYVFSVIMTSLLIVMGPIFIPMMLFKQTFSLFESWWKQLLSFFLQPIMVFSSIALFNIVLITLLQSTLNFTVCPNCILGVDLSPLYSACWIPGYYLLLSTHLPEGSPSFIMPGSILAGTLSFLLVGQAAYGFCGFMAKLAATIVAGTPIRTATIEGPASNVEQSIKNTAKAAVYTAAAAGATSTVASNGTSAAGNTVSRGGVGLDMPDAGSSKDKGDSDKYRGNDENSSQDKVSHLSSSLEQANQKQGAQSSPLNEALSDNNPVPWLKPLQAEKDEEKEEKQKR